MNDELYEREAWGGMSVQSRADYLDQTSEWLLPQALACDMASTTSSDLESVASLWRTEEGCETQERLDRPLRWTELTPSTYLSRPKRKRRYPVECVAPWMTVYTAASFHK